MMSQRRRRSMVRRRRKRRRRMLKQMGRLSRRFSSCFNQQTHVCQCSASTYIYSWKLLLWSRFNCEINNSNTPELNVGNGTGGTLMAVLAQIWSELREKYFPDFGHFGWLDQMQILHWEKYKHSAKQILPRFWAPGEVVLELCWRFWRGCDRKKWKNVTHIQSGHTQEG